jgi:hypothetical protein
MSIKPKDASGVAYQIQDMLRCCICAEDTVINVDMMFRGSDGIYLTLEVAEAMMGDLIDDIEQLEASGQDNQFDAQRRSGLLLRPLNSE